MRKNFLFRHILAMIGNRSLLHVINSMWHGLNIHGKFLSFPNDNFCQLFVTLSQACWTASQALRLSSQSRRSTTTGEIVNLMSVDSQKIYDNFLDIHEVWACIMGAILSMAYLWSIVGPSALAAVAILAILAPLGGVWMTVKYARLQVIPTKL